MRRCSGSIGRLTSGKMLDYPIVSLFIDSNRALALKTHLGAAVATAISAALMIAAIANKKA